MSFTIKDFLNLDIITNYKLVTNTQSIEHRIIESISVTELPVENFVHNDELVLTTCIGCSNNSPIFLDFIKDIYNSGASALVVSVGRHVKETPKDVIDYANDLNFPIIEIPWEIRFAGIIEYVLEEINNVKQANLKLFENLQKKLLTLFLNGSTLTEAANLIYKELGNQTVIANTLGTIRGASKDSDELLKILEPPLSILSSENNLSLLDNYDCKDIYRVYKIGSKNMTYGYLYLKTIDKNEKDDYVSDNKTYVVRHIVSPISFWFDREQTIFETEMHHKDNFVWDLIKAEENEFPELYNKSKTIGYDLSLQYVCVVGLISDFEKSYELKRSQFSSYEEWKFNCIKTVKSQILRVGQSINQEIMLTFQKERLIIFLEINHDDQDVEKSINEFLDTIEKRIKPIYPKLIISWGIDVNKVDYYSFNKVFLDAKISLEIGRKEKKPGFRNIYHNTSIYRLLSIISRHKEAQEIIINIIGSLIDYDTNNKLDLINTFKVYMENKGNVSQTSRSLHLHRQSLLYRLKRIEEITNLSIENADDIFLLQLCIRLWDKQNNFIL